MSRPTGLPEQSPRFYLHNSQGGCDETYCYKTKTGDEFFVKNVRKAQTSSHDAQKLLAQREYATLTIMSLLGLKVPTEFALIENKKNKDLFLIKRKVADREENKAIVIESGDLLATDKDWNTRRDFVLEMLDITDLYTGTIADEDREDKNSFKVRYDVNYLNPSIKKLDRYVDIDPSIANPSVNRKNKYLTTWAKKIKEDPKVAAALGKTKTYFEENIKKIFSAIDVIEDEKTQIIFKENLERLGLYLESVTRKDLNPSKPYTARKIAPALDFKDLAAEIEKTIGYKLNLEESEIKHYSVASVIAQTSSDTP